MTVTPACICPKRTVKKGGKLIICNLQKTPLDNMTNLQIYALCDDLMKIVMKELNLPILPFILYRRIQLEQTSDSLKVSSIDVNGIPCSIFSLLKYKKDNGSEKVLKKEPFIISNLIFLTKNFLQFNSLFPFRNKRRKFPSKFHSEDVSKNLLSN